MMLSVARVEKSSNRILSSKQELDGSKETYVVVPMEERLSENRHLALGERELYIDSSLCTSAKQQSTLEGLKSEDESSSCSQQTEKEERLRAMQVLRELSSVLETQIPLKHAVEAKISEPSPTSVVENCNNNNTTEARIDDQEEVEEERQFVRLSPEKRTRSLPNPRTQLPSKPSLKGMSSIGANTSSNKISRNVSFGNLEAREYNVELSTHPSCSYGPPIQLAWDYQQHEPISLDDYENVKEPREMHDLVLSYNVRRHLLMQRAGYSPTDLEQAMREVDRVKRERMVTDMFSPVDETVENVIDGVRSFFGRGAVEAEDEQPLQF